MTRFRLTGTALAALLLLPLAAQGQDHSAHGSHGSQSGLSCAAPRGNAAERPSPYDSIAANPGGTAVKVCFGRPSVRGRQFVGHDAHPFGQPWRFGANEATQIHVAGPVRIGDVPLAPGSYSLFAVPGAQEWEIVANRNWNRWGIPIDAGIRSSDVGSTRVTPEALTEPVETLTFRFEEAAGSTVHLVVEWERWRVRVPVTAG